MLVGDGLASYLQKTHRHSLESKDIKALEERYKIPTNMPASAPIINKNIWEKLPKELKDADKKDKAVQALGVTALCPLLSVVETLTKAVGDNQPILPAEAEAMLKKAVDSAKLMTLANRMASQNRRERIKPCLEAKFAKLCEPENPVGSTLFGDTLEETI
jgi:hypothetical protein